MIQLPPGSTGAPFLGWFTRSFDLAYPTQDASPGGGGLGPLPRSGVRVTITKRA